MTAGAHLLDAAVVGRQYFEDVVARNDPLPVPQGGPAHIHVLDETYLGADAATEFGEDHRQHPPVVALGLEAAADSFVIILVDEIDIRLEAVEDGRRDGDIAFGGETIHDVANMAVDAENLLNDDDGAFRRTVWVGAVGAQLVPVGGR